mgnify:CR=1 FL=1
METKSNTQEIFDAGITVTEKAAQRLAAVMEAEEKKGFGLRMEVTSGGCSGMNYNMSFEKEQKEFDKVFENSDFDSQKSKIWIFMYWPSSRCIGHLQDLGSPDLRV